MRFLFRHRAAAISTTCACRYGSGLGMLEAMAILIRRRLPLTRAPIFTRPGRMPPQVALAKRGCRKAILYRAQFSAVRAIDLVLQQPGLDRAP